MVFKNLINYETIYVIGHAKPDTDSIISSKILADIFNNMGINSKYAVLSNNYNLDDFSKSMINDCMEYNPVIINNNDIDDKAFFLVDHNDPIQSIGEDHNIAGCIDHHPNNNKIDNIIITDYCSTALFIYDLFKAEYKFSESQKKQIFMAFLADSKFGKSSRYTPKDEQMIQELGFNEDYNQWFKKYFKAVDISKGIESVFNTNYKKFNINDCLFESSYLEAFDENGLEEYINLIEQKEGNFLGIWCDYIGNKTKVFFKLNNELIKFEYPFAASRATTIIWDVSLIINNKTIKKIK